ncbi:uncharacterized protein LOC119399671 isoform X2 [Rhipicephalus sanguineus]|nr:uncharacterized protein LOC119399671 isoform X2 [Rhipicephalus sanguineus]
MKKCVKFWSFLLIVLLCTYWEQCSTTKTNARSLRKMNLPAVILVLLLCITFSGSQKASKPQSNKKCKREVYPKSWTEAPCQIGKKVIKHGETGDSGSIHSCLGVYCLNGITVPVECGIRRPQNTSERFYTRRRGPWPKCCYWNGDCKNNTKP